MSAAAKYLFDGDRLKLAILVREQTISGFAEEVGISEMTLSRATRGACVSQLSAMRIYAGLRRLTTDPVAQAIPADILTVRDGVRSAPRSRNAAA